MIVSDDVRGRVSQKVLILMAPREEAPESGAGLFGRSVTVG